jgi:hypothetical protein
VDSQEEINNEKSEVRNNKITKVRSDKNDKSELRNIEIFKLIK